MTQSVNQVLAELKEIASTRELTKEEKELGRAAAKAYGQNVHVGRIESENRSTTMELERLQKRGYTKDEATAEIKANKTASYLNRGFGTAPVRCRLGSVNRTDKYSRPGCSRASSMMLETVATIMINEAMSN